MKLSSTRAMDDQRKVLKDPSASGPDPVYWVFSESTDEKWANVTIIAPGKYGDELPKTFGHYHPDNAVDETYHLIEGEGVLQMMKKHFEGEVLNPEIIDEVYLIKAKPGDEVVIKNIWGHSWSNVGDLPLISFDDWRSGHQPSDYEPIERMHGMAYYLVKENGEVRAVPNPNYKGLPEPKWVTADEFKQQTS